MSVPAEVEQAVAAGAALLDRVGPDGWRERVAVDRLRMANGEQCVLAQAYGMFYMQALSRLAEAAQSPPGSNLGQFGERYGFEPTFGGVVSGAAGWRELQEAWESLLAARQG